MMKSTTFLLPLLFLFALPLANAQQGAPKRKDSTEIKGIPERIGGNIYRAPSIQALKNKAQKSYDNGNYYGAMQYYQRILTEVDTHSVTALYGYARAATAYTLYGNAAQTYQYMGDSNLIQKDETFRLELANTWYLSREYKKALDLFQEVDNMSTSADIKAEAKIGINNCNWAIEVQDNVEDIMLDSLRKSINTPYSEYSNVYTDDQLYYSSYSMPYKGDSSRLLIQVLTARRMDDGEIRIQPVLYNEENRHTAYVTFNREKTAMYYAVGKYNADKAIKFELYRRKRLGDNTWGKPEKLPKQINHPKSTTTQPFICSMPGEAAETLFFVSDRPGGKGKKDIWYAKIENDTFSQPVNLISINTPGDDVSPFYHAATGVLYFSSNGRQSLGGFDIYRSEPIGQDWAAPQHLPEPLNSTANDVFYSISEDGKMRHFSSNRNGAINFSEEDCCYDIFKYCEPQEMPVSVCDAETGDSLTNTTMQLFRMGEAGPELLQTEHVTTASQSFKLLPGKSYLLVTSKAEFRPDSFYFNAPANICDPIEKVQRCLKMFEVKLLVNILNCDGSEPQKGVSLTLTTVGPDGQELARLVKNDPDSSEYLFQLRPRNNYALLGSLEEITADAEPVTTFGLTRDTIIRRDLNLGLNLNLEIHVFNESDDTKLNDVIITLMRLDTDQKWVRVSGLQSNRFDTLIAYDGQYRIFVEKNDPLRKKFSTASIEFDTDTIAKTACRQLRKNLYLRRIPDLPITLFFDNDEPGPHTSADRIPQKYNAATRKYEPLIYEDIYFGFVVDDNGDTIRQYYCHTDLGHKCYGNRHHCFNAPTDRAHRGPVAVLGYYNLKNLFIDRYTEGETGADRLRDSLKVDAFFEDSVKGEWNRLRDVFEAVYTTLEDPKTKKVTIEIRGYASPLGNPAYNEVLTSRRVNSVERFFRVFDGGVFMKHINSGKLILKRVPNGAGKAVIGGAKFKDGNNRRESVYSVEASRERRVEVVGVDVQTF